MDAVEFAMSDWTADDIRLFLAAGSLTQEGFARYIGVDGRTVRRWCSGGQLIPLYARRVLELYVERYARDAKMVGSFVDADGKVVTFA